MSSRRYHVEIPLRTDGRFKFIKGVTKHTTCGDVVKMVLKKDIIGKDDNKATSYGLFESSRGIERLLPGKSRLLKVMRTWGSATDYEFVLRKVNPVMSIPKVSEAKRRKLSKLVSKNTGTTIDNNKETNSKGRLDNTCATKTHNKAFPHNENVPSACSVKEIYYSESDNTMHEFVSNGERNPMSDGKQYCNDVTSRKYNDISSVSDFEINRNVTGRSDILSDLIDSRNAAMTSHINEVKYAVRKTLKSKSLTMSSSTSSLRESELRISGDGTLQHRDNLQSTPCEMKKSRTKHSRSSVIKHNILAQTIKSQISQTNQKEGKEVILKKYFADYLYYRSPTSLLHDTRYRGRGDGAESHTESDTVGFRRGDGSNCADNGTHNTPTNAVHVRNHSGDVDLDVDIDVTSDSGQEDDDFDVAFIDGNSENDEDESPCFRKLVDYSLTESDISEIECDRDDGVSNISSASDIVRNVFADNLDADEDDEMDSFMITKLSDDISDEGLSSLGSDDEREKEFVV